MKLVVGLGNAGEKYKNTRHNAGFMLLDELSKHTFKGVVFTKSQAFMNDSGKAVKKIVDKLGTKPEDLYIVHDDLDLRLGEYKIKKGVGPKVHNGVNSVEDILGTSDFWRVRIGIDNRSLDNRTPGEVYVLEDFDPEEKKVLEEVNLRAKRELLNLING